MTVSKQTKEYVMGLIRQSLNAMKKNQFEADEDLLRSAKWELHDANMNMPEFIK